VTRKVGNGADTLFWTDTWLGDILFVINLAII